MPAPNHNKTEEPLYVTEMVYNRLPMLAQTEGNNTFISRFILEVMADLDVCFHVDEDNSDAETDTWLGDEAKYSIIERVVIADVVSIYILMNKSLQATAGASTETSDGTTDSKYLKSTKAGSVEVEWEQIDVKKGGGLFATVKELLTDLKQSARRRARQLECGLSFDNDDMQIDCLHCNKDLAPFKVFSTPDSTGLTSKEIGKNRI